MTKAFISYSWDDLTHKTWVREFASGLRKDGIETILDQWHSTPGEQLPLFMEQAVRDNDFVLVVCTPKYKTKYDNRAAGVGYEGDIIQGEIFVKNNHRKFIPILRRGNWEDVAPSALLGSYYIDLRDGSSYASNYEDLVLTLQGRRPQPPTVGISNSEQRLHWTLVLDGICDDAVKSRVEALAKHLQQLLGDSSLTIEKVQPGSIVFHLKSSKASFDLMKKLVDSGQVTELAELKILRVCTFDDFEEQKPRISEFRVNEPPSVRKYQIPETTLANITAQELIAGCLRGEEEAWKEFVHRWQRVIVSVVVRAMLRFGRPSPALVDDLTQDVFLKLSANGLELLKRFQPREENAFVGFLKVVATNVVHDHFRTAHSAKRGSAPLEVEEVWSPVESSSVEQAERDVLLGEIDRFLQAKASDKERMVFWLYYRQGYTAKDIAAIPRVHLSVKGVESMLFRLTRALRSELTQAPRQVKSQGFFVAPPLTTLSENSLDRILRRTPDPSES
jgi:RNA polymerase sigma factor (sigma-70 family)